MLDFTAHEEPIIVNAGDAWQPVWTFYDENDAPADITGLTFDFIVTNAKTGATVETATCTVVSAVAGQVQTRLSAMQLTNITVNGDFRYRFRVITAGDPTTVAKGAFGVSQ